MSTNTEPAQGVDSSEKLSKNQKKKQEKRKIYEDRKLLLKALEKKQKQEKKEIKFREIREMKESMTSEEWQERIEKIQAVRGFHKSGRAEKKEKLKAALETGQRIILDLEFSDLMTPDELRSLAQQVKFSYAANAKSEVPCSITLAGINGAIKEQLTKFAGFDNWLVNKCDGSFVEAFPGKRDDVVYLTADSNSTLQCIDNSKIYVVGGLVDRNRNKNITLNKAVSLGIATARLPITDHVQLTSSSVLTVNQVIDIILHYVAKKDWKIALELAIPERKRGLTKAKGNNKATEDKIGQLKGKPGVLQTVVTEEESVL